MKYFLTFSVLLFSFSSWASDSFTLPCPNDGIKVYTGEGIFNESGLAILEKGFSYGGSLDEVKKISSGYYIELRLNSILKRGEYSAAAILYFQLDDGPLLRVREINKCKSQNPGNISSRCFTSSILDLPINEVKKISCN